jgi:formylglycine-generating enzyme required for sulfatase activity
MMGDGESKVLTTISKPFEIMSVDITQKTYSVIVKLLKQNFRDGEYNDLNAKPSFFRGENRSVDQVSYEDITLWKKGLNKLSKLDNVIIQKILEDLFPGHQQGHQYSRPTEAQWEYVSRLGGLAESDYSHGKGESDLSDHAVYSLNSGSETQAVGLKKPVFYNGKPIYDLHGNVWKWLEDWYGSNLTGGMDPQGATSGSVRIIRGGSWTSSARSLRSGNRGIFDPDSRYDFVGFRLVRTSL